MNILARMKISTKIMSLLALLGVVTMGVATYAATTLSSANSMYNDLVDTQLPGSVRLARVNRQAVEMAYAGYRAMAYDGSSAQAKDALADEALSYQQASNLLDDILKNEPDFAAKLNDVRAKLDAFHNLTSKATLLGTQNRNDEARHLLEEADARMIVLSKTLKAINDIRLHESDMDSDMLTARAGTAVVMIFTISIVGLIGALAFAMFVSVSQITRPIGRLQETMRALAGGKTDVEVAGTDRRDEIGGMAASVLVFRDAAVQLEKETAAKQAAEAEQKLVVQSLEHGLSKLAAGDLTAAIDAQFSPTYASVKSNFNEALTSLRELIGAVMESTRSIQTGSTEIAHASEDLARRTEANAASLEETSAAVHQMDDRLKATAVAATHTVDRADGAIGTVSGGREIADEAMQAMGRVSESAKGIDSVIEGLDKIAFQTRVLAMNAAVEAGRAGEAGRGFAVVADLVSALAMRAEEEAGRARDQLTATQTDIVTAVEAVRKVDDALSNIVGDVGEVHSLVERMSTDNQAQSTAITQISSAVGTMDHSTQQNAAMVEQTSAAARNLHTEVTALAERAARFKTGAEPVRAVAAHRVTEAPRSPKVAMPSVAAVKSVGHEEWTSF